MARSVGPVPESTTRTSRSPAIAACFLAGLLLAGYGLLVAVRVLAHEAFGLGILLLITGTLLIYLGRGAATSPQETAPERRPARGHLIATLALGIIAAGGVLAYNLATRSTLSPWELAILAYGALLLAAAPRLADRVGRMRVGDLVAWSLPVVAAPIGVFALDAAMKGQTGGSPVDAFLVYGLVAPMTWALSLLGFAVKSIGQTVLLTTPRGTLALGIGLVCAGFQPGILFLGVLGLHAWKRQTPPGRLAAYLALGLLGVYVANLIRLIALALVGYQWGGAALQTAHAHLGWILFFAWILVFWWIVLRRLEGPARPTPKPVRDGNMS